MERIETPAGVRVRPVEPEDVDRVVSIEAEAFPSPWSRQTFLDLMNRPTLEILVLEHEDGGVIGYAVLWCIMDQGELANVAVTPARRGCGYGTFLLNRVLEVARGRGIRTVFLEVRESNEAALRLYGRFGFSDVGVRRGYYELPAEDARVMRAVLD